MNHPEEFTNTSPNCIIKWVLKERQHHAILVTRRIVLAQFCLLFLCIVVLFLSIGLCLHVCLCSALFSAM